MVSKATIKFVQSLKNKKYRIQNNAFVAEGSKMVSELFNSNIEVVTVFSTVQWMEEHGNAFQNFQGETLTISSKELKRLSFLKNPQEVLAVCSIPNWELEKPNANEWNLYLDGISDPGNLGTIIRTADWFGLEAIFCAPTTVDAYNPKVVQATMGSIARVKVVYRDWQEMNPQQNIYAAEMAGEPLYKLPDLAPGMIVIGNEAHGVSENISNEAKAITIPRKGKAESLNAAIAAGIIMNEIMR